MLRLVRLVRDADVLKLLRLARRLGGKGEAPRAEGERWELERETLAEGRDEEGWEAVVAT